MNILNKFENNKNKKENKRYKKLIAKTKFEKIDFLNPNILSKKKENHNIDNIKMKYGFLLSLSPQFTQNKIQSLKNKYLNNNFHFNKTNNYINNNNYNFKKSPLIPHIVDNITYEHINRNINSNNNSNCNNNTFANNNNNKKNSEICTKKRISKNNFFRSTSLQFVKENNIIFNNVYNRVKNKKRNEVNNDDIINQRNKNIINKKECKTTNTNYNSPKFGQSFKYLRNTREDFISVDKKLNDILKSEAFNKSRKKQYIIFPISKKINMLSEVKKDIKKLNKKSFGSILNSKISNTGNSLYSSHYSDFPKNKSENNLNVFYELFNDEKENSNLINYENEINKPILIKSLPRPKLNVPKYLKFL